MFENKFLKIFSAKKLGCLLSGVRNFFFLTNFAYDRIDKRSECAALLIRARAFAGESSKEVHARNRSGFYKEASVTKSGTNESSPRFSFPHPFLNSAAFSI
jgi:hypothetical protein